MGGLLASCSKPRTTEPRMVAEWTPLHVRRWLAAWGVPSRVTYALLAAEVDGKRLRDLFYNLHDEVLAPWQAINLELGQDEKKAVLRACNYLDARSWVTVCT
jgi:hypothetical protein